MTNDGKVFTYDGVETRMIPCTSRDWTYDALKDLIMEYWNLTESEFHDRFTKSPVSICWFDHSMPVYDKNGKMISPAKMNIAYYIQ